MLGQHGGPANTEHLTSAARTTRPSQNAGHESPTDTMPYPGRMENLNALPQKPENSHISYASQNCTKQSCLLTLSKHMCIQPCTVLKKQKFRMYK
jgi:hypothetical protein